MGAASHVEVSRPLKKMALMKDAKAIGNQVREAGNLTREALSLLLS